MSAPRPIPSFREQPISRLIFMSRWLQLPLYMGLIIAQGVYVYYFWVELVHLVEAAMGSQAALESLVQGMGYQFPQQLGANGVPIANAVPHLTETVIMLAVLALIDVVMISNLLVMVIVGGYETFVSRLNLRGHPDEPEWLSHVNASVLKIKLAMAIVGISSISLLRTFIEAGNLGTTRSNFTETGVMWQVLIHLTFIISAIGIAWVDRLSESAHRKENGHA